MCIFIHVYGLGVGDLFTLRGVVENSKLNKSCLKHKKKDFMRLWEKSFDDLLSINFVLEGFLLRCLYFLILGIDMVTYIM